MNPKPMNAGRSVGIGRTLVIDACKPMKRQHPDVTRHCSHAEDQAVLSVADQSGMTSSDALPVKAGLVPDGLTIWPVDDGRYGLDATFQGASGYQRAGHHEQELSRRGVPYRFIQELDGGWTLRFGPLRAVDVAGALGAFVY